MAPGQASSMVLGPGVGVGHRVPPGLHLLWSPGAESWDAGSWRADEEAWCQRSLW